MKVFTAIYNTELLKGVKYSFAFENIERAIEYAEKQITVFPNITIVENDNSNDPCSGKVVFVNGTQL